MFIVTFYCCVCVSFCILYSNTNTRTRKTIYKNTLLFIYVHGRLCVLVSVRVGVIAKRIAVEKQGHTK